MVVISSDVVSQPMPATAAYPAAETPTRRICTPQDVAYLASAAYGHVNGEILAVVGGRHLTR